MTDARRVDYLEIAYANHRGGAYDIVRGERLIIINFPVGASVLLCTHTLPAASPNTEPKPLTRP